MTVVKISFLSLLPSIVGCVAGIVTVSRGSFVCVRPRKSMVEQQQLRMASKMTFGDAKKSRRYKISGLYPIPRIQNGTTTPVLIVCTSVYVFGWVSGSWRGCSFTPERTCTEDPWYAIVLCLESGADDAGWLADEG